MSLYRLVFGKVNDLPIKLEHRAMLVIKQLNFDLDMVSEYRKLQLNEFEKTGNDVYKNALIYKEKMKVFHDKPIL